MRFTLPLLACIASLSFAAPIATPNELAPRDATVVDRAVSRSQSALLNLQKSLDAYYHSLSKTEIQQTLIMSDSEAAVDALNGGAKLITTGPQVDRLEKAVVATRSKELLDQIRKVSDSWVRCKSAIVGSGGRSTVADAVRKQASAANNFATTLVSKMPGGDRDGIAVWFEKEVNQAVTRSVVAFT